MTNLLTCTRGLFSIRTYGDSSKPPLILVHGWPQTSYSWNHTASYLKDFYCIAPDLRGMGDSNRELDSAKYAKDEMAKDIFSIADGLGMDQFYLAGHDWGGGIVQEMSFLQPERIRKLIILNMIIINNAKGKAAASKILAKQLYRSSWYQFFMSMEDFPEAMIAGKEELWIRFFSRGISHPIPEDAIQEYIRCFKIPNTITTTSNLYREMPSDRKRWQRYEKLVSAVPTKIIHGILDPVIVKEYLIGVEECFKTVEVRELNGGHFIVDEQPEKVAYEISSFLIDL